MIKMKEIKKKYKDFFLCGVLTVEIVFIISKIFEIILISPDDSIFQNVISGVMTGVPDGHCYFIRYPLAVFLAILYKIYNGIAWYQLFLVSSLMLSFFLIFTRVNFVAQKEKKLYLIIAVFGVVMLFTEHVVHLEWTVTAGILGTTAIYRYMTMPREMSAWESVKEYGICFGLIIMCFCLRNTVAYIYIPFAGICWVKRIVECIINKEENARNQIVSNVIFCIVCMFTLMVVMFIHNTAYNNKEWNLYKEYTEDRSALVDYYGFPDYEKYSEKYEAAGISAEAYELMDKDYNFLVACGDFENMDLSIVAEHARELDSSGFYGKIVRTVKTLIKIVIDVRYFVANIIIVIMFLANVFLNKHNRTINAIFVVSVIGYAFAISTYLVFKGRLPERVVRCIAYGTIGVLTGNLLVNCKRELKFTNNYKEKMKSTILPVLCGVLVIGVFFLAFSRLYKENAQKAELAVSKLQISNYCQENPENIYLRDFQSFSQRGELFARPEYVIDNYWVAGGWSYNSPVYNQMLHKWNYTDFYDMIINNENVYYLVTEKRAKEVVKRINTFLSTQDLGIMAKRADEFATQVENVVVLKFVCYR